MEKFQIEVLDKTIEHRLRNAIDQKTKPLGALGKLESIALQIGNIQQSLTPELRKPTLVIFAGDHGITAEGVSSFPQEVTYQMVYNFLNGGAAINVFARQHGIALKIVDAGVNFDFDAHPGLMHAKIGNVTANYLYEPAMSNDQCNAAIEKGAVIVEEIYKNGTNVIGFGEMGIGNTSSASLIMSRICNISIDQCIGKGTGLDHAGIDRKRNVLKKVLSHHAAVPPTPLSVLQTFGGFEIAMMCGAYLKAAQMQMVIMVDGFIATSALLVAAAIDKKVLDYCIFSHVSDEQGHALMLQYLNASPILNLQMRLGEGTGVAVAYPIIASSLAFLNEMASFEKAGVKNKDA